MNADANGPGPKSLDTAVDSVQGQSWQRFTNKLTIEDFAEAERITPAHGHIGYWFFYTITRFDLVALCVLAVILVPAFVALSMESGWSWQNAAPRVSFFVLLIAFFGGWTRRLWAKRFGSAQERFVGYAYDAVHEIGFGPDGLRIEYALLKQCDMRWDEFVGFREGRETFILIRKTSHEEVLISKRSLPDTVHQQFRGLLDSNVGSW